MKILVVDDDPMAGMLIGAILEEGGHEVITVENGVDAADEVERHGDLAMVVSDMHMPLINGVELFRTLREQGVSVPFILLTGNDLEEARAQEPGLDACLMKDDELEQTLPAAVEQLLAKDGG